MPRRRTILWIVTLAVVAAFTFGLVKLVLLRFAVGDVYPAYSTLRSDPLGSKALFEALREIRGPSVRRNYEPLTRPQLPDSSPATLFYLGVELRRFSEGPGREDAEFLREVIDKRIVDRIAQFVAAGGRLVISYRSQRDYETTVLSFLLESSGHYSWLEEFGYQINVSPSRQAHVREGLTARRSDPDVGGEQTLLWHSGLYLTNLDAAWRTVYACKGKPVIVERTYEAGTVVVMTDSYPFSNEAMQGGPSPELLAWLAGEGDIVFDETHLGVARKTGFVGLARHYNLTGALLMVVLLAGLFVWKNAVSFVPRDPAATRRLSGASVAGRGSDQGLVNLLQKSIPLRRVLSVCVNEWARSAGRTTAAGVRTRREVESVVEDEQARGRKSWDPAAAYRSICRILSDRKRSHGK